MPFWVSVALTALGYSVTPTGLTMVGSKFFANPTNKIYYAATGAGISGACVAYPKQSAAYENSGGTLTMKADDLLSAFQTTLRGQNR